MQELQELQVNNLDYDTQSIYYQTKLQILKRILTLQS